MHRARNKFDDLSEERGEPPYGPELLCYSITLMLVGTGNNEGDARWPHTSIVARFWHTALLPAP